LGEDTKENEIGFRPIRGTFLPINSLKKKTNPRSSKKKGSDDVKKKKKKRA